MFCSTIIPTIDRSTLSRSVNSVLEQSFQEADFEVIVVNDSGKPLLEADWQKSERVRIIHTDRRKLSVARNSGAAIARGTYLHFLDDDDWLLPNAFENFWILAKRDPEAAWLYGGTKFVDATGKHLGILNLEMSGNCYSQLVAGSWIPVQASLIRTQVFFAVGGFHPLFLISEEIYLGRQVGLGHDFAHTPSIVTCMLRGTGWATTARHDLHLVYNRWSRDNALSECGSFARMRSSANSSYWHGRNFHAYSTSFFWNWRKRRAFTALSRAMFSLISLLMSVNHILSTDFWRAVRDTQVPCSQNRILEN